MTDFLYTKQSFVRGLGSIGNLSGKIMTNYSETPEEADTKAIAADWMVVGKDIEGAIRQYAEAI